MVTLLTILATVAVFASSCESCQSCQKEQAIEDPLQKEAQNLNAEARRLFLTCAPENYLKAIELYKKAIGLWADYPEALAGLAETVSMYYGFNLPESEFQAAYMSAQRAIRLAPESDLGYRAMADLFRHHTDPKSGEVDNMKALDAINRAIKLNPNSAENLYVQGSVYLAVDPPKALQILLSARAQNPNLPKIYFNLASGHQILAELTARQATKTPEEQEKNKQVSQDHYQQAIEFLKSYQAINPSDLNGYVSMGNIYYAAGDLKNAEDMYNKTLSINQSPDISQIRWRLMALDNLSRIYQDQHQDLSGAKLFIDRALQIAPYNGEFLNRGIDLCKLMNDKTCEQMYRDKMKEGAQKAEEMKKAAQEAAQKQMEAKPEAVAPKPNEATPNDLKEGQPEAPPVETPQ